MSSRDFNFSGGPGAVHEVAALVSGLLVAGHFDVAEAADAAIARLGDTYTALWSTLNPLATLPEGRVLNPSRLTRGSRVKAEHIARRTSGLIDFDPPRPKGTMSTDVEHQAALQQAQACRTWLHSGGWPLLPVANSGSGFHLRPFWDLDVSKANSRLVERVLRALKTRFSYIDSSVHDLPRLCRYYGSWNCKGENSVERPWRMSSIVDAGEPTRVTVAQLEALWALVGVPEIKPVGDDIARPEVVQKFIRRFTAYAEGLGATVAIKTLAGKTLILTSPCLLHDDHDGAVGITAAGVRCVQCFHARCAVGWSRWSKEVERIHGQMKLDGGITWTK